MKNKAQCVLIGKNLRNLRESRGLSQTMLGHALGVSFQQIQKYERGESVMSVLRLHALCRFLGVPYETLLAGIDRDMPAFPQPAALPSDIMTRAWKIKHSCSTLQRAKLLKIIDIITS